MKRLIPLIIALALPTFLFAQNQAGSETRNGQPPGIEKSQDLQLMNPQDNTMNRERLDGTRGQPGADVEKSRDRSRDQQRQARGDDNSRRHHRHGAHMRRSGFRGYPLDGGQRR